MTEPDTFRLGPPHTGVSHSPKEQTTGYLFILSRLKAPDELCILQCASMEAILGALPSVSPGQGWSVSI